MTCCLRNLGVDLRDLLGSKVFALLVMIMCFHGNTVRANGTVDFGQSQAEAILALDASYFARLAINPGSIGEFLHKEFRYLTHYQTELSKPQLLKYLRHSPKLVEAFQLGDRYVMVAGDQALVWGTVQTQGDSDGFESVDSRYWHVWQQHGSQWFLLRRQAALLYSEQS